MIFEIIFLLLYLSTVVTLSINSLTSCLTFKNG